MGGIEKDLAELPDMTDRKELVGRVEQLLKDHKAHDVRARILRTSLDLAPRVGEDFALILLAQLAPTCDGLGEPADAQALEDHAKLLEKSLFAAAHFGRGEYVQALVTRFQKLLATQPRRRRRSRWNRWPVSASVGCANLACVTKRICCCAKWRRW
jgi:hypothetical protein